MIGWRRNLSRRRVAALVLAATVGGATASLVHAHDAEHTAVSLTFTRDGLFVLDVVNDPNWLLLRLESFESLESPATTGTLPSGAIAASSRDARLRELARIFVDRIVIFVDGREVRPASVEYLAAAPHSRGGTYRMRGRLSPDAHVLRWYYGMVVDPYPLTITRADGRSQSEWIVSGEAWSRTIDLSGQFVRPSFAETAGRFWRLGFQSILPLGPGHVLFILGMLLNRRVSTGTRQLAGFTLVSAIALWLTVYSAAAIPPRMIGAVIALSVAYVTVENLLTTKLQPWRVPAVSAFAAAHGVAFGQPLREAGLDGSEMFVALTWATGGLLSAQLAILALVTIVLAAASNRTSSAPFTAARTR